MRAMRWVLLGAMLSVAIWLAGGVGAVRAQETQASKAAKPTTGYAVKKPVLGGACPTCPWGSIAEIVKAAVQPYGYDVQICYSCAGGAKEARLVAAAAMPPAPQGNGGISTPPPPNGPIDFGATGAQYLWWAYEGVNDFAKDPEGPRKQFRVVANIQDPQYYVIAVKADSGITDLHQIVEKRMPVQIMASSVGGLVTQAVLDYYNLSKENVESYGGKFRTGSGPDARKNLDVIMGFGNLDNAPEYNMWYEVSHKNDLRYLRMPDDLIDKLVKQFDLERRDIPPGVLHGITERTPAVARTGTVIYGRTDMPDDFAYTLAKALDEHQDLLQWANGAMNFSYNYRTVWKCYGVPLHPGAERYYKERGYMK